MTLREILIIVIGGVSFLGILYWLFLIIRSGEQLNKQIEKMVAEEREKEEKKKQRKALRKAAAKRQEQPGLG